MHQHYFTFDGEQIRSNQSNKSNPTEEGQMITLLKPNEVAKILRVSPATVRRLINRGDLKAVWVGDQRRVESEELTRYLQSHPVMVSGGDGA